MIKFIENEDEVKRKLSLKLHPTLEKIKIMKKYRLGLVVVLSLLLVSVMSITSFASVEINKENRTA